MRSRWLVYSALSLALPLVHAAVPAKPNVWFILVDDFGVKDAGIEGSIFYEPPNLDALARSSMRFTRGCAVHGRNNSRRPRGRSRNAWKKQRAHFLNPGWHPAPTRWNSLTNSD